jgi:hypothetical protein
MILCMAQHDTLPGPATYATRVQSHVQSHAAHFIPPSFDLQAATRVGWAARLSDLPSSRHHQTVSREGSKALPGLPTNGTVTPPLAARSTGLPSSAPHETVLAAHPATATVALTHLSRLAMSVQKAARSRLAGQQYESLCFQDIQGLVQLEQV